MDNEMQVRLRIHVQAHAQHKRPMRYDPKTERMVFGGGLLDSVSRISYGKV